MTFQDLALPIALIDLLNKEQILVPTPIQEKSIPAVLAKKDVLGIAKTGSGKTLSYALPILTNFKVKMGVKNRMVNTLILVPTRELAEQVKDVFLLYSKAFPVAPKIMAVYGGVSINPQMKGLFGINILIATPGRLLELVSTNAVQLSGINTLVIDEADKMLNLGFKDEMDKILALLPQKRQNLLYSATLSEDLESLKSLLLNNPDVLDTEGNEQVDAENVLIKQTVYLVTEERKGPFLRYLLKNNKMEQSLIFASSVHKVDTIAKKMQKNGIMAEAIHSKKTQGARKNALIRFKNKETKVLVTTDLLSRGIDIAFLPFVINYELPRSPKDFIHRIGRTGRAENPGEAITLITPEELTHFKVILKKMKAFVELIKTDEIDLHGY